MKFFSSVQKVILPEYTLITARNFSDAVTITTDYSDANQNLKTKVASDHFISKLGEEATKIVMNRYAKVVGPDYAVYTANQKSWQADLLVNEIPVAVKTQKTSAALRYGLSWTFQCGTYRKDTILMQPEAWVVFVEYDDLHPPYCTCYVLPPLQVKDLCFDKPKLPHLQNHKMVVYAHSLPKWKVEVFDSQSVP